MNDPTTMDPPWSAEHAQAAELEGWNIFQCTGSVYGDWQVQRDDEANTLPDDDTAMLMVNTGTGEHHSAARAFIAKHNPPEFERIRATDIGPTP